MRRIRERVEEGECGGNCAIARESLWFKLLAPHFSAAVASFLRGLQWVAVNAGGGETATSVPALLPATGVPLEVYSNSLQLAFWSALLGLGVGGLAIAARRKSN